MINLSKFACVVAIVGLMAASIQAAEPSNNFKVFLCFGQSNMSGGNGVQPGAEDKATKPRIKVLAFHACPNPSRTANQWYDACEPMHCGDGMNTLGPSYAFGRVMADSLPNDTIGLIPAGLWGVSIEMFMRGKSNTSGNKPSIVGNNAWDWMLTKCKTAVKRGVFTGIILHQGESNSGQQDWPNKVKSIYDDLKKELGITKDIPLIAGELLYSGQCSGHNSVIAKIPQTFPLGYVASAQGLSGVDAYHFNAAGYRELGKRFAQQMMVGLRKANPTIVRQDQQRVVSAASIKSQRDNAKVYSLDGRFISDGAIITKAGSLRPGNIYVVANKRTGAALKLMIAPMH